MIAGSLTPIATHLLRGRGEQRGGVALGELPGPTSRMPRAAKSREPRGPTVSSTGTQTGHAGATTPEFAGTGGDRLHREVGAGRRSQLRRRYHRSARSPMGRDGRASELATEVID